MKVICVCVSLGGGGGGRCQLIFGFLFRSSEYGLRRSQMDIITLEMENMIPKIPHNVKNKNEMYDVIWRLFWNLKKTLSTVTRVATSLESF